MSTPTFGLDRSTAAFIATLEVDSNCSRNTRAMRGYSSTGAQMEKVEVRSFPDKLIGSFGQRCKCVGWNICFHWKMICLSSVAHFTYCSVFADRPMRSTQEFLRRAIELRSEFFHCCIFADNLTSLSTVQSYL